MCNLKGYLICIVFLILNSNMAAQQTGKVTGSVTKSNTSKPLERINVRLKGTTLGAATNSQGRYTINGVPPGTYTLVFSAIGFKRLETNIEVAAGEPTIMDAALLEEFIELGNVTVYAASKHLERITEAPAAISIIPPREIRMIASTGQIPRLFETAPGVDIVQNGVYDYNLNTRGFNSSRNRRVLVLLDNRETSIVFFGSQQWNTFSFPLEDLDRVELVRGPGSALYGANAYSGVVNLTTPAPRDVLGTKVKISGGELNTLRFDLRHAGSVGPWSYKFNVGHTRHGSWCKSRNLPQEQLEVQEYAGLTPESFPIDDDMSASYGSARLDYNFNDASAAALEGGFAQAHNLVEVSGIGRLQIDKSKRPWGRITYTSERLFFQTDYSGSKGELTGLNSGVVFTDDSYNLSFQFQHNFSILDENLRFIWGASHRFQHQDTNALPDIYDENQSGLFGQAEYQLTDKIELVGAGRVDRSTLHDTQFSPKAAIVFAPTAKHSFRVTFNRAFQTPNFGELFSQVPTGPPVDLAPLEAGIEADIEQAQGLPPGSVDVPLNFGVTPRLVLGNENLEVEKVQGYELGYKGVYTRKFFVTADVYFNRLNNFVTDLLPGINPAYPAYQLPEGIDPTLQPTIDAAIRDGLGDDYPLFSTLPDGSQAFVLSITNAGKVNQWGFEIDLNYYMTDEILLHGNWTHFDFDVRDKAVGDVLLPNTPPNKFNVGLSYEGEQGIDANVDVKYVEKYEWAAGVFQGPIPEYTLVHLSGGYKLNQNIRLGLVITNLLDNDHYEIFGGSLIGRRALGSVTVEF